MKPLSFQVVREGEQEKEREGIGGRSEEKGGDHLGRGGRVSKCGTKERGQLGVCVCEYLCVVIYVRE